MAVGNVVLHYFASKRSLVHALILSMLEHYQVTAQDYLRNAHGKSSFPALLRWYMRDSVSPETSRLFRELWAMALHDPAIAATMDRFYDKLHRLAADRLRVAWPGLSRQRAHDIAQAAPRHHFRGHETPSMRAAPRSGKSLARVARLSGELLMHAASTGGNAAQASALRRGRS